MASRTRGWCFTVNNYTDKDIDTLLDLHFEYMVIGFEIGKKRTPHIQGYVYFHSAITFETAKRKLPKGCHIERQKGSPDQAAIYCMKDGEFYTFGELPVQGRAKYAQIEAVMEDPTSNFHLYQQYKKTFTEYKRSQRTNEDPELCFIPYDARFTVGTKSVFMDADIDTYQDEDICIFSPYTVFNIENWYCGHAPRIRRGYEVIPVNPKTIYLTYDSDKELNFLKKKYIAIAYRCIPEGELETPLSGDLEINGDDQ